MNTLARTADWFSFATPQPTPRDVQTQIGVHIEEVREMVLELESVTVTGADLLEAAQIALHNLAEYLKNSQPGLVHVPAEKLQNFLDSLCDQIVTATGVGTYMHFKMVEAMDEVNYSNFSKFGEDGKPIRHPETNKILKGPYYVKPDLAAFLMR